jgi:hypothetical protein
MNLRKKTQESFLRFSRIPFRPLAGCALPRVFSQALLSASIHIPSSDRVIEFFLATGNILGSACPAASIHMPSSDCGSEFSLATGNIFILFGQFEAALDIQSRWHWIFLVAPRIALILTWTRAAPRPPRVPCWRFHDSQARHQTCNRQGSL